MRVVHISSSSTGGGAAIAARRLHEALTASGIESALLTGKDVASSTLSGIIRRGMNHLMNSFYSRYHSAVYAKYMVKGTWSDGSGLWKIADHPKVATADVIFLHWINGNFISINEIGHLLDIGKPVVWILHDMWPLTG